MIYRILQVKTLALQLLSSPIMINACLSYNNGQQVNSNWGDDINTHLISKLFGKSVLDSSMSWLCKYGIADNYIMIGSTLSMRVDRNTIVWGGGVISDKSILPAKPKRVLAVRGPLTRKWLLSQDVLCPEVYGDPALFAPYIYTPHVEKEYEFGFIPHYSELGGAEVCRFVDDNPHVHVININKYGTWTDFIDEINRCKYILSSSLHGLIISDAYGIRNAWVAPSQTIIGGEFKFRDYFESTDFFNRNHSTLVWSNIFRCLDAWKKSGVSLSRLASAAPFKLNIDYKF